MEEKSMIGLVIMVLGIVLFFAVIALVVVINESQEITIKYRRLLHKDIPRVPNVPDHIKKWRSRL